VAAILIEQQYGAKAARSHAFDGSRQGIEDFLEGSALRDEFQNVTFFFNELRSVFVRLLFPSACGQALPGP
jgi:hypothetical protein